MKVPEYLNEKYGLNLVAGQKTNCPKCGRNTFSIKSDGSVGKCFHSQCSWYITERQTSDNYQNSLGSIFDKVCLDSHEALLTQKDSGNRDGYSYLVEERNVDESVIRNSMVGVVPDNYNINRLFGVVIEELESELKQERKLKAKEILEINIDYIKKCRDKLGIIFENCAGYICFYYTDIDISITSIHLRRPYTKEFKMFKATMEMGVFGIGLFIDSYCSGDNLILCEGEFDALSLQSLYSRNLKEDEEIIYNNIVGIGGASNPDFKLIKKLCNQPLIINDADEAGRSVIAKAKEYMNIESVEAPHPYKDIDEYISSFGNKYKEAMTGYENMLNRKSTHYRYLLSVEQEIDDFRKNSHEPEFLIKKMVSEILIKDMCGRGRFLQDQSQGYYFNNEASKLVKITQDDQDLILLLSKYGFNLSENIFRYVLSFIASYCFEYGLKSYVHKFAYYDKDKNLLYISNSESSMYKISSDKIELVENGENGVIFYGDKTWKPFKMINTSPESYIGYFDKFIASKINFEDNEMSQEEQKYIFEIWFYGIFFETLFPTKCIICFLGPKGSGKSITLRKVGILMHGDKFNVSQLPNDQKDFLVTVANSYFVALDNVDSKSDWLEDSLATLATGGVVRSRKLYSDSTLVELELHAFIGITSRTPAFRRDDISERLLLMYLSRIDEFKPEHSLLNEVNLNRNEILTDVLLKLHEIIKGLVKYRDIDYKGKLRMADFASFAYKFAAIDNKVSFIESIFDKIAKNQSLFTLERDPIMDFLTIWLEDGNEGRFISYKDLCGELSLVAERTNEKFLYKNFRSFSQKMSHIRSNIEIFFDVEERSLGARNKVYSYRIKDKSSSVESEGGKSESNILF